MFLALRWLVGLVLLAEALTPAAARNVDLSTVPKRDTV